MEEAQEALISPDLAGPITSLDHRSFNSMLMDYLNSFLDFTVTTGADQKVKDDRLIKRVVSKVVWVEANIVISEDYISKLFGSDTLEFAPDQRPPAFTKVTISFKQQPA